MKTGKETIMKDIRVKISVANNLLLSAIENAGYKSLSDFARKAEISIGQLYAIINMKRPPIKTRGDFTPTAKKIMNELGMEADLLWSLEQLTLKVEKNYVIRETDFKDMKSFVEYQNEKLKLEDFSLEDSYDKEKALNEFESILNNVLTPRQADVFKKRHGIFGERFHTPSEVADYYDVSVERIRQIQDKATQILKVNCKKLDISSILK